MSANNQAAGAMNALGMTPPGNDLRDAVARDYVLVKRGLYYRPDSLGYTGVLDDAGRYTAEDAKFHNDHCSDVKGILVSEAPRFSSACWPEIITRTLEADLAKARADLERVTAENSAGYLFHNPDTGTEWSESHPVESGEVDDATDIRLATANVLKDELLETWGAAEELRQERESALRRAVDAEAENTRLRGLLAEARATNRRLHRRLQAAEGPTMARAAKAERAAAFWFKRRKAAGGRNSALRAENTRLRALLVDLKTKADGQLAYWRQRMAREKCLDDGVSEDGQTYTPIGDSAAWQGGYCNGRLSEADWWRSTLKYDFAALDKAPTPKEPA